MPSYTCLSRDFYRGPTVDRRWGSGVPDADHHLKDGAGEFDSGNGSCHNSYRDITIQHPLTRMPYVSLHVAIEP